MKRILAVVFLAIVVLGAWYLFFKKNKNVAKATPEPIAVKKHSDEFNKSIDNMLNSYFNMKDAFVDADTSAIKLQAGKFISSVDSISLSVLKTGDSLTYISAQQNISDIIANAKPITEENDLTEMRHDFSMVSENLYPFLKTIGYEGKKIFWQNCPMAFGDDKPANWLSNSSDINNPYLGKKNPQYKSAMLHCGENMDSIYLK
jgi:hypothetical protein